MIGQKSKKIAPEDEPGIPVENIPPAEVQPKKSSVELNWDENLEDLSEPEPIVTMMRPNHYQMVKDQW